MSSDLLTRKKRLVSSMESALMKQLPVGDARRAAKDVYRAVRDDLAELIVLEPIEGIERDLRKDTLCATLRAAYSERNPDRLKELLREAYNYAQRMNERLLYYHKRAPFLGLEDDTNRPKRNREK